MAGMPRLRRRVIIAIGLLAVLLLAASGAGVALLWPQRPPVGRTDHLPEILGWDWTEVDVEHETGVPGRLVRDDRATGGGYAKEWTKADGSYLRVQLDRHSNQCGWASGNDQADAPTLLDRLADWRGL
jgi:hypothetical protein